MDLKLARQIAQMTQPQLAKMAGVDPSFISLIENGKRDVGTAHYAAVVRVARALNVTAEELFPVAPLETEQRIA